MITLAVLTIFYFLPTIIRAHRGHGAAGTFVLNLFFGWTGIGWIALLLWALLSPPRYYVVAMPTYYPSPYWRR